MMNYALVRKDNNGAWLCQIFKIINFFQKKLLVMILGVNNMEQLNY